MKQKKTTNSIFKKNISFCNINIKFFISFLLIVSLGLFYHKDVWSNADNSNNIGISEINSKDDYNVPLYYPPAKNKDIVVLPPKFLYSVRKGDILYLHYSIFTSKSIKFSIKPAKEDSDKYDITFIWPYSIITNGELSLVDKNNEKLWDYEIDEDDIITKELKSGIYAKYVLKKQKLKFVKKLMEVPWLRFCGKNEGKDRGKKFRMYICSNKYVVREVKGKIRNLSVREKNKVKVLIDGRDVTQKGILNLNKPQTFTFSAYLSEGDFFELQSFPPVIEVVDWKYDKKNKIDLRIKGGNFDYIELDFANTWNTNMSSQKKHIKIAAAGNVPLKQEFMFDENPPPSPFLHKSSNFKTYSSKVKYNLKKSSKQKIKVVNPNKSELEKNDNENDVENSFYWTLFDLEKGEFNDRYLEVKSKNNKNQIYGYQVYRHYKYDLSLLLSGLTASVEETVRSPIGETLFYSELFFQIWFEDILWLNSSLLTRKRWGVNTYYLSPIKTNEDTTFNIHTIDFRYRFTPGIYEIDETFGTQIGYQNFSQFEYQAPMMGLGFFWSQPLPKFWRMLLEWLPIFRFPKWMILEATYYFASLKEEIILDPTFTLLFSGKVFYTDQLSLQAGIGYREIKLSIEDSTYIKNTLLFGNIGLNYKF